jgi:hypothetical protein
MMANARRVFALLPVAFALAVPLSAFEQSPVSASCMTGAFPTAVVSGVVVSTSIQAEWGVFVAVQGDDGSTRNVLFGGRNPNSTLPDGSENTVEDAWGGELPEVGGRYAITAVEFDGSAGPLSVNNCAEAASVERLSPSAVNDVLITEATAGSDAGNTSGRTGVAVTVGAAVGVGVLALILRRRSPAASA